MKKIIIATDFWFPEVNGIVRVADTVARFLRKREYEVVVVHPGLFIALPILFYPFARVSLFISRKIEKILEREKPDYIHIATEGTVGLAMRTLCVKKKIQFTTSYQGNVPYYAEYYTKKKIDLLFKSIY